METASLFTISYFKIFQSGIQMTKKGEIHNCAWLGEHDLYVTLNMKTNETHERLLTLVSKNEPDAYKAIYDAVTSALLELTDSWSEGSHEMTDRQLTEWSRLARRICSRLDGRDYSVEYEAGRLSGIVEAFEYLYKQEEDTKVIDTVIAKSLSSSKPASKQVLHILFEAGKDDEWVSNARLEKECLLKPNALSNIMKRLIQANAAESIREGRTVSYRISSAGKRYCENNPSLLMKTENAQELRELSLQVEAIREMLDEMNKKRIRTVADTNNIEGSITDFYHFKERGKTSRNLLNQVLLPLQNRKVNLLSFKF